MSGRNDPATDAAPAQAGDEEPEPEPVVQDAGRRGGQPVPGTVTGEVPAGAAGQRDDRGQDDREHQRRRLLGEHHSQRGVVEQQAAGQHRVQGTEPDRDHGEGDADRVAGGAGLVHDQQHPGDGDGDRAASGRGCARGAQARRAA